MSEFIVFAFEVCCKQRSKQRSTYVALEWPDLTGRRVSRQDCSAGVLGARMQESQDVEKHFLVKE